MSRQISLFADARPARPVRASRSYARRAACLLLGLLTGLAGGTALAGSAGTGLAGTGAAETPPVLQVYAEMEPGPGNITLTPQGAVISSLHQFYAPEQRVVRVHPGGRIEPYAQAAKLDSVLGLQSDARGMVWLLDNAMRGAGARRLVGWDHDAGRVLADIPLGGASPAGAFLNDLAVDAQAGYAYIADPAGGADAALIVVDLRRGTARRVLQGHHSVVPEDIDLVIDGTPVRIRQPDGSLQRPRVGVNPIALDAAREWLYFGPMHGRSLYRIRAADLRNADLAPAALAERVERYSDKPICDGIAIDRAGNIYLGDLARNAIGVISPQREYRVWVRDPLLSWVDAFAYGPDGYLYLVANQLHRSAALNGGTSALQPPLRLLRLRPLAPGVVGR